MGKSRIWSQTVGSVQRPWSIVAADLLTLHSKNYIVLVDFYSDFIEVSQLSDTTSGTVIQFFREQFSRHGIPDCLMTDNGSQIVSHEFTQFATDWEFKHVTSSPRYPKSNRKAEAAVKVVKTLFKKALKDERDPWLALLDHRNTPTEGLKSSPVQRLMSRRARTLLPTATGLLHPKVVEGVQEKIKEKKKKAKYYHDRSAKVLPELEIGQEVKIEPLECNQAWKSGTCVKKLSDRSYLVKTPQESVRRNRQSLKPAPTHPSRVSSRSDSESQTKEQEMPTSTEDLPVKRPSLSPPHTKQQKATCSPSNPVTVEPSPKVVKTRTRIVKPPLRY